MKKKKYYAAVSALVASFALTSCSNKEADKEIVPETVVEDILDTTESVASKAEEVLNAQIEREKEEAEAFEKAVLNPDFIYTPEFALVNRVSITWNNTKNNYEVECSDGDITYTVNLPEERLVSYMLKRCNCEYLYFHDLKNTAVISELSSITTLKEISIYNSSINDLSILKDFSSLEGVRIENCANIEDLSFFEYLPNISAIAINGTKVSDLTPLSNLTNLTWANLRCNEITNPEVLSDLPNLKTIKLEFNKIEDIAQLSSFIEKEILSQEMAESVVETTTNHALIFSSIDEETAVNLTITYYDAQKEYYAEARDDEGSVISFIFTQEPYNFYDISKKLCEQKYLCINNFPTEGYIHHLWNWDDFKTVEVVNCDFESFYMPDNVENLTIYNCPNMTESFKAYGMPMMYSDLKYLSIKNTGITGVEGLDLARYLESLHLENNKIENYDFLLEIDSLNTLSLTIDSANADITILDTLRESGVEVYEYDGSSTTSSTTNKETQKQRTR